MKKIKLDSKKTLICVALTMLVVGVILIIYISNNSNEKMQNDSFNFGELEANQNNINGFEENNNLQVNSNTDSSNYKNNEEIYIHIIGEVNNEGIIKLNKGERIVDAIEKAGGVTEKADLSKVNLAFVLSDGQKLRIPSRDEINKNNNYISEGNDENIIIEGQEGMINSNKKININTANQTELETISGIGPSIAAKIIQYREKNGKFKKVEDLKNVSGIGTSKYELMKNEVEV